MSKEASLKAVEFSSPASYLESGRILPDDDTAIVVRDAISVMALLGGIEISRDFDRSALARQPEPRVQIRATHFNDSRFVELIRAKLGLVQRGGYIVNGPETWDIVTNRQITPEPFAITTQNGVLGMMAPYRGGLQVYSNREDRRKRSAGKILAAVAPGDVLIAVGDWYVFGSAGARTMPHHSVLTEFTASRVAQGMAGGIQRPHGF